MKIEIAKEVAKSLLWLDVEPHPTIPFIATHPVFESMHLMNKQGEIIDALNDEEKLNEIRADYEQRIDKTEEFSDFFVWLIRKPYILCFIKFCYQYGAIELWECGYYLMQQWCRIENIGTDANVKKVTIRKWLVALSEMDDNTKHKAMGEEEWKRYCSLPDTLTLYRGVRTNEDEAIKGLSWSRSKDTAKFFANRYGKEGYIYQATVKKEDVFFTEYGRNEQEYIVDYKKLTDIQLI